MFFFILKGPAKFSKIIRFIVLNREFARRNDGKGRCLICGI